jgi:hypothetical protein
MSLGLGTTTRESSEDVPSDAFLPGFRGAFEDRDTNLKVVVHSSTPLYSAGSAAA